MNGIIPIAMEDAPLLASIHEGAFGPQAWSPAMFMASLNNEHVWGLKILEDFGAFGFVLCQQSGADCEILTFAVLPARQHQGHGRRLLQAMIEAARSRGNKQILLEVAADNRAARKFYDLAGFIETGSRPDYYVRPHGRVEAILMALPELENGPKAEQ